MIKYRYIKSNWTMFKLYPLQWSGKTYNADRGEHLPLKPDADWNKILVLTSGRLSSSSLNSFSWKSPKNPPFRVVKHWSPVSIWSADRRFFKLPQTALSLSLWDAQIWRENLWERYGETGFLTLLIQIRQERLKWQNSLFY